MNIDRMMKSLWEDYFKAMLRQEYAGAVPIMEKLVRLAPEDPQVRLKYGDLLARLNENARAVAEYHKSAAALVAGGSGQKALAIYKLILRLAPEDAQAQAGLGELAGGPAPARKQDAPARVDADSVVAMPDESFGEGIELEAVGWGEEPQSSAQAAPAATATDFPEIAPGFPDEQAPEREIVVPRIFASISKDDYGRLAATALIKEFENGAEVFREGEPGESMFVILGGQAVVSTDFRGRSIMIALLDEGDFFGEMALLTRRPRTATVTAFGGLRVMEIEKTGLKKIIDRHPGVLKNLVDFYYSRVKVSKEIIKGGAQA